MKTIRHIKKWNQWRKRNRNGKLHHVLVLFGIIKPPTFMLFLTKEEYDVIRGAFTDLTT